jgi:hypothetical protein
MILVLNTNFILKSLHISLYAMALMGLSLDRADAAMDPFVFCSKNCSSPGPCDAPAVKAECANLCTTSVWKNVAAAELKSTSDEFRGEKDITKKEKMVYQSKIAKCLGLESKETPPSPLLPAAEKHERHDLCKAALQAHAENFGN